MAGFSDPLLRATFSSRFPSTKTIILKIQLWPGPAAFFWMPKVLRWMSGDSQPPSACRWWKLLQCLLSQDGGLTAFPPWPAERGSRFSFWMYGLYGFMFIGHLNLSEFQGSLGNTSGQCFEILSNVSFLWYFPLPHLAPLLLFPSNFCPALLSRGRTAASGGKGRSLLFGVADAWPIRPQKGLTPAKCGRKVEPWFHSSDLPKFLHTRMAPQNENDPRVAGT